MTTTQFITFSSHLHVKRIRQHIKMSEKRAHFREMVCNVQIKLLICRMSVSVSLFGRGIWHPVFVLCAHRAPHHAQAINSTNVCEGFAIFKPNIFSPFHS